MKKFEEQKKEINRLHRKYKDYLKKEYGDKNYSYFLSNPDNFIENTYYHQANSFKEKEAIIKNGFDKSLVSNHNCGVGRGLYLGRDKNVLINFYSDDLDNPQDFILKIVGNFNFLDLLDNNKFLQKNKNNLEEKVLAMGYDGIRYYDPDATGEEFVLFNF